MNAKISLSKLSAEYCLFPGTRVTRIKLLSVLLLFFGSVDSILSQEPQPGKQIDCKIKYQKSDDEQVTLRYKLFVPEGYDGQKEFPLMLFLHGAGERGDDLDKVQSWGPPKLVQKRTDFPFVVISPQCPRSQWWTSHLDGLAKLVGDVSKRLKIDQTRVYCTGLSMGGYGTWALCAKYPKLFAAAAPICGGGKTSFAESLKELPIWAFHGDADRVVPLSASQEMVDAVKKAGGKKIKLTVYEGVGHNSWSRAYATEELYKWFLSHSNKPSKQAAAR